MKLLATFAIGSVATASFGSILYDNGGPNQQGGNEMTHWIQSEDVPFNAGHIFNKLVFWTLEADTPLSTVSVNFSYDDGFGNPGYLAVVKFDRPLTSHTFTGNSVSGLNEYENVVLFGPIFEAGTDGIFHMELLGNEGRNPTQVRQDIYWETTNGNGSNTGRESEFGTRDNWADNFNEHAFRLENTTPEPASMTLLGLGAVALVRRRHK